MSAEGDYWLDWLEAKPWTTLFVDGNHEDFELLDTYPVEPWAGGLVRRVRPHVMHLCRGEVFDIGGRSFFCMGGAHSIDRQWRVPFESWWPQEVPNGEVRALADEKVAEAGEVDFVLTHCPPAPAFRELAAAEGYGRAEPDEYMEWLQGHVADRLRFKRWFYGHMHVDAPESEPFTPLYDAIFDLDGTGRTPFGPGAGQDCRKPGETRP